MALLFALSFNSISNSGTPVFFKQSGITVNKTLECLHAVKDSFD